MASLYVRTNSKRRTSFYRAGMQFTAEWREVEVDEATVSILFAEQMLQVSKDEPAGFKPTVVAVAVEAPIASAPAENTPPEAEVNGEAAEAVDEAAASADSAEKSQGA